jgi:demethylmenaquinone methyltransferase/2-methoxy-6-polyprenyl-1,4-benzoquinol methylase
MYLPDSVQQFPQGEEMAAKMRAVGLVEVEWHPLTFGVATLYVGTKPPTDAAVPNPAALVTGVDAR